ncbi:MAG TPA: Uma2 family endonuclease [Chthonomonadaceae bacterium]|nr:Uma2 family endonuclease [Chthonomonadaceae bacterium]
MSGRYELIDGEVIAKMPINPPHRQVLIYLHTWLVSLFGALFVQTQSDIEVDDADPDHYSPQPDVAVTTQPTSAYTSQNPGPRDLTLVAEISDSSLRFDRTIKANYYALLGIPEYWVVDIAGREVIVHRQPSPAGYAVTSVHGEDERIATLARPGEAVVVSDILPAQPVA